MLVLSKSVTSLLQDDPITGKKPDIQLLTFIFLMLNFLAATQDIAVDGWALTMLSRRNVGYASTCNTAGQTAGFFIGNVIFLALESADFSNKYLRSSQGQAKTGIVTFEEFLYYCGLVFLVVTILVALLKKEKLNKSQQLKQYVSASGGIDAEASTKLTIRHNRRKNSDKSKNSDRDDDSDEENSNNVEKDLSVHETYSLLYKIIKLPSFKIFALVALTCKIGFSAPDAVSGLKLVEAGVHKENLAMLAVPMVPLQIVLPWVISRITCGPRPLDLLIKAYPWRLMFGLIFPLVVYWTPSVKLEDETFPFYYYLVLLVVYGLHQITVYSIFVASMAFSAAISDPSIGGTYMTLLNTISNLGGNWPSTTSLWLVDKLTFSNCTQVCTTTNSIDGVGSGNHSATSPTNVTSKMNCVDDCRTTLDGYYIECLICVVFGFLWLQWGVLKLRKMQSLPPAAWSVSGSGTGTGGGSESRVRSQD